MALSICEHLTFVQYSIKQQINLGIFSFRNFIAFWYNSLLNWASLFFPWGQRNFWYDFSSLFDGYKCPHLLFQLLILAFSVSIFSLYSKKKKKTVCGFHNILSRIFKFLRKYKTFEHNFFFRILIIQKPFLGSPEVPHNLGPIGSPVTPKM